MRGIAVSVCLSMAAAEAYYESVGRTWERAAYIKARACAGRDVEGVASSNEESAAAKNAAWRRACPWHACVWHGIDWTPYAGTNRIRFCGTLSADDHWRRRHPGHVREG